MESIRESFLHMAEKKGAAVSEQNDLLLMTLHSQSGVNWHTFLSCSEEERLLICYLLFPGTVSTANREKAIHKTSALNYDLKFGTFEYSEDLGEIRFRASQFVPLSLCEQEAEEFFFQILQVTAGVAEAGLPELLPLLTNPQEESNVPD